MSNETLKAIYYIFLIPGINNLKVIFFCKKEGNKSNFMEATFCSQTCFSFL